MRSLEVSIPCLRTLPCLKMHQIASQRIFISKSFRQGMPPDPPRKLVDFDHSGLLLQTINLDRTLRGPKKVSLLTGCLYSEAG